MRFTLSIDTDNDAFHEGPEGAELSRLLRKVADEVEAPHGHTRSILDANGNRVGSWKWWNAD